MLTLLLLLLRVRSRVRGHLMLYIAYLEPENQADAADDPAGGQTNHEVGGCLPGHKLC